MRSKTSGAEKTELHQYKYAPDKSRGGHGLSGSVSYETHVGRWGKDNSVCPLTTTYHEWPDKATIRPSGRPSQRAADLTSSRRAQPPPDPRGPVRACRRESGTPERCRSRTGGPRRSIYDKAVYRPPDSVHGPDLQSRCNARRYHQKQRLLPGWRRLGRLYWPGHARWGTALASTPAN